jgi:hypothetical protein
MFTIILCIAIAVLLNLPVYLRARNLRKFSEAKLDMARVLTRMEQLMLNGDIKLGEICHDHLYEYMTESMHRTLYPIEWAFWKSGSTMEEHEKFHAQLQEELANKKEVGKLVNQFIRSDFSAFRFNRPIMALCFTGYVIVCSGGFKVLLLALLTIVKYRKAWRDLKQTTAECYSIYIRRQLIS